MPDFRLDRKRDVLKNPGDDRRRPLPDLVVDFESIEEDDEIMPLVWWTVSDVESGTNSL